jgi:ActR/RegA family two-component response regulator
MPKQATVLVSREVQRTDPHAVLVIDDDQGVCQMMETALATIGCAVSTAAFGADAVRLATGNTFELMLIDLQLPDMLGTQVVRALRDVAVEVPFVLISGYLTVEDTVGAMKLGAIDVIEKPVAIASLLTLVSSVVNVDASRPPAGAPGAPRSPADHVASRTKHGRPRSAAERWAMLVCKACESEGDPKTLEDWADCAGVSYSSLRESCRLLDIRPHAARDLVRVLRAVIRSHHHGCPPSVLLDVSDIRTLDSLLTRAGIRSEAQIGPVAVERLLDAQRLVDNENEGVRILRRLLLIA